MKIAMIIVLFFLIAAFFIISNENIHLNSQENIGKFFSSYAAWIDEMAGSVGSVSGYLVKMDWLPDTKK